MHLQAVRISHAPAEVHRWSTSFCLHWYCNLWLCRKWVHYWTRRLLTHPWKQDIVKSSALENHCWHTWPPDGLVFKKGMSMYMLYLNIFSHIPAARVQLTHWAASPTLFATAAAAAAVLCPIRDCFFMDRSCQTRVESRIVWIFLFHFSQNTYKCNIFF